MTIPQWFPICLSLFLFVLSLFREEIRRFLRVPPTKARNWWNSGMLNAYETELKTLKSLQGNPYELLIYALSELGSGCRVSVFYLATGFLVQILLTLQHASKEDRYFFTLFFFGMVPIFIAGSLVKVGFQVKALKEFDKRVVFLEARIVKYKSKS